jgi:hypothetical protein
MGNHSPGQGQISADDHKLTEMSAGKSMHLPAFELAAEVLTDGVHRAVAPLVDAIGGALGRLGIVAAFPHHEVRRVLGEAILRPSHSVSFPVPSTFHRETKQAETEMHWQ